MPEERKLVTILFADIVGSTAIGAAHDPEVVRKTLARTFAEMRQILAAHGATVEKFIGDAVMAVFGVPQAHDDDADRAVRAAFALRDRVALLNERAQLKLELRIGVNTGEVVAGTGDGGEFLVTGEPVNAAARLQQAAAGGEILAGPLTRRLSEGAVRYGSPRVIEAKGIGALEVAQAEALTSALPEQRRGLAELRAPLIGRDEELRVLVDAYRKTSGERRAYLVTVFGEAGVGKSRLVQEFVETIGASRVRRGRCLPYGEGITFWPVLEILRAEAGITALDSAEDATKKLRAAVLGAFGEASADAEAVAQRVRVLAGTATVEAAMPAVAPESIAPELRWGLRRYLERRAQAEPLTLVFEDIHWAETTLLELIEDLAEWARAPLFLICLARPELRDLRPGWGGGMMNAAAIRLEPLTAQESRRLIGELLAIEELPETLRAEVVARSEGNPLYVEEFLRMLIDGGHIARRDGRWIASASLSSLVVPPTLQGLIAARLDRVPGAVKRTLQRASVVGKAFWTDALTVLGASDASLDEALTDAARRDLILELDDRGLRGGRAYSFKHLLIRDVAYASIPKEERFQLHDAFGRWLEEAAGERVGEYGDILAYHAEQAFLLARELGAPEAAALGERAFERLLSAATKARHRADGHAALVFYERAAAVAQGITLDPARRGEAVGFAALSRYLIEGRPEALAGIDRALEIARAAGPSEVLVTLLWRRGYAALQQSLDVSRRLFDEAIAAAQATADPELVADAMLAAHWTSWWAGDLEEHHRVVTAAYDYMRASGARGPLARCLGWLSANVGIRGDFTEGRTYHKERRRLAEESGSKLERYFATQSSAAWALPLGDHARAIALAEEALALAREVGERELVARSCETLGEALHEAGELVRSRVVLEEGLANLDPVTMRGALPELQWRLSRACLALGDLEAARRYAEASRASVVASDVFSRATSGAALAAVRAAEGNGAEAERLFREALAIIEATGYGFLRADLRREFAQFLISERRASEARALLEAARAFFRDPLAGYQREKTDALLRRCDEVTAS